MLGIVIQARMGSTRLPGKIFKKIGDKSLLEHIFFRLKFLQHSAKVVLATSELSQDDVVEDFCKMACIDCFRGSEQNVLERYYLCSKKYEFKNIVRLTGDNPFTDIQELDRLIDLHVGGSYDYSNSFDAMPLGVGAEIFTFEALRKSFEYGHKANHVEHVNEYILENLSKFNVAFLDCEQFRNQKYLRLTVDTEKDYQRACYIVANCKTEYVSTDEAIRLCMQFV